MNYFFKSVFVHAIQLYSDPQAIVLGFNTASCRQPCTLLEEKFSTFIFDVWADCIRCFMQPQGEIQFFFFIVVLCV